MENSEKCEILPHPLLDVDPGNASAPTHRERIIRYFEIAGPDYAAWSKNFNMHLGFYRWGINPFRRERMLEQMNEETLHRLSIPENRPQTVVDLGCGLGTVARYMAHRRPAATVTGVTIVPWQAEKGNRLSEKEGLEDRVSLILSDYTRTPFSARSVDAAYAIESACYATGFEKADLIEEAARILRPGGRFVVSDEFRKHHRPFKGLMKKIYRTGCRAWAVEEMADIHLFVKALRKNGFKNIQAEEVSWKIAPSFAHAPFLCLKFTLQQFLKGDFGWKAERWHNLIGPLMGSLMCLSRKEFGYYLVRAEKE